MTLVATPENMEKCKDIPGVVALDLDSGSTYSADAGDYFMYGTSERIMAAGKRELVLAVRICHWVDPLSGEPIQNAQITVDDEQQTHEEETRE